LFTISLTHVRHILHIYKIDGIADEIGFWSLLTTLGVEQHIWGAAESLVKIFCSLVPNQKSSFYTLLTNTFGAITKSLRWLVKFVNGWCVIVANIL